MTETRKETNESKMSKKIFHFTFLFLLTACFLACTVEITKADTTPTMLVERTTSTAQANLTNDSSFTVEEKGTVYVDVFLPERTQFTIFITDSDNAIVNNPMNITVTDSEWEKFETADGAIYCNYVGIVLQPGSYTAGIRFPVDTDYAYDIMWEAPPIHISREQLTLANGLSHKLTLTNIGKKTVQWKSSNKKIAVVDKNGKVTAKANKGSCKISATVDGKTLTCKVNVQKNVFTDVKVTPDSYNSASKAGAAAYQASYDDKGNMLVKICFANNSSKNCKYIKPLKIIIKTEGGKTIASYKVNKQELDVKSGQTKCFSVTIPKKNVKLAHADLRSASVTIDGTWYSAIE